MALSHESLFKQAEIAADKLVRTTEQQLVMEYKKTLTALRSQLADAYAKYAQGDVLTHAEMSKYNRMNTLFDNINKEVKKLGQRGVNHLIKLGEDSYEASFYRSAYAIEAGGGPGGMVSISWGQLSPEVIKASVMNPLSGLNISERYAARTAEQLVRIREQITQSLLQGESYPKMAKRIKDQLDGDATRAMRVARTEGHRNTQAGRLECIDRAESKGVDLVKIWSASLDSRTRDAHGALDGQEADADGYFHINGSKAQHPGGFGVPELDINCRCSIRSQIRGFAPKVRRVRGDGEVAYKDYKTWKAEKDGKQPETAPMKVEVPKFTPAKSVAEADAWARERFADNVNLPSSIDLKARNSINEGLDRVLSSNGVRIRSVNQLTGKKRHTAITRWYDYDKAQDIEFLQSYVKAPSKAKERTKQIWADNVTKRKTDLQRYINDPSMPKPLTERNIAELERLKYSHRWTVDTDSKDPLKSTAMHEAGHAVMNQKQLHSAWEQALNAADIEPGDTLKVSDYAASNRKELFAEVTALVYDGRSSEVPERILAAYRKVMPDAI